MFITEADKVYIAGFFDGEGSVSIPTPKRQGRGRVTVTVANTNREVLEFLKLCYGGYIGRQTYKDPNPKHKPCYIWIVTCRQALTVLSDIEPYLKIKKLRVQIAIEYQKRRRLGRRPLSEEERAVDEAQRIVMSQLNKRGLVPEKG